MHAIIYYSFTNTVTMFSSQAGGPNVAHIHTLPEPLCLAFKRFCDIPCVACAVSDDCELLSLSVGPTPYKLSLKPHSYCFPNTPHSFL